MSKSTLQARDILCSEVVTIDPDATVREAAELLDFEGITGVPVVDASGAVLGVLSASDIVRLVAGRDSDPWWDRGGAPSSGAATPGAIGRTRVREIMTPALLSVRESTTLPELASFLLRTGVHRALVVRGQQLVGVVTTTDVLRCVAQESDALEEVRNAAGAAMREAVCTAVRTLARSGYTPAAYATLPAEVRERESWRDAVRIWEAAGVPLPRPEPAVAP